MNFVIVEILQGQAGVLQYRCDRIGRGHQQALLAAGKVHRPGLAGPQIGQYRQLVLGGPLFRRQQQCGRAIGQRCAVPGGETAAAAQVEYRLEL